MPVLSLACHLPHNTPNIPSRYNNEQTTKQTKAINNSYIYIYISCKCDTNRAGHFTLDAYASRPVACLISLSPYPREISQATMMAGSSRWQSAVIGGNGAWRARMRTMNHKSNRTCLYRRSDRGPVLVSWWCSSFLWVTLVMKKLHAASQHPVARQLSGLISTHT